jgi:hypothetical protein
MSSNQKKVYGGMVSKKATDGKRSEDVEIVKFCEVPVSVVDMQDLSEKLEHLFSVLHEVSDSAKELPTTALLLFGPELLQFNLEKKILRYFSNFKAIIRDFGIII